MFQVLGQVLAQVLVVTIIVVVVVVNFQKQNCVWLWELAVGSSVIVHVGLVGECLSIIRRICFVGEYFQNRWAVNFIPLRLKSVLGIDDAYCR